MLPPGLTEESLFRPAYRRLRGYTFDPSLSAVLDTAPINETVYRVTWEKLERGPVGEYLEVVDYDPASRRFYPPVDLDHHYMLAQDGFRPSENLPQSHQQIAYAVAMTTIANFEKALGRPILWRPDSDYNYVQRLRIYPHAMRAANAFYSPNQKALLFGYFPASEEDGVHAPGSTVFTCLSHDIIAHETTHALLDGMHRRFVEPTHPDALAFHEGFADIVALFQHFTFPESLRHQIAKTRGDLKQGNLLAELAQEFGRALGNHGALRSALTRKPDPQALETTMEPHARGGILVAAVFDAFNAIYERRAAELIRLATAGSGVLPPGALPDLLVQALSAEAAKTAGHFLGMCIRALDYCPPAGLTYGDYLRALITVDHEMEPEDAWGYRIALIDAFRHRGIFAGGVKNLSDSSLLLPGGEDLDYSARWLGDMLGDPNGPLAKLNTLRYSRDRRRIAEESKSIQAALHELLRDKSSPGLTKFGQVCGLALDPATAPPEIERDADGIPKFEVGQFRTAFRARPDGTLLHHVVVTLTQRRRIKLPDNHGSYSFRGGATLIIDLENKNSTLRHLVVQPITDEARRQAYEAYIMDELSPSIRQRFFMKAPGFEPFAFLHGEDWEEHNHE